MRGVRSDQGLDMDTFKLYRIGKDGRPAFVGSFGSIDVAKRHPKLVDDYQNTYIITGKNYAEVIDNG